MALFNQNWERKRKDIIIGHLKSERKNNQGGTTQELKFYLNESQIDTMGKWSKDMQISKFKQIMRKTSDNDDLDDFKHEHYIAEICRSDDFYQTFEYDEEEVKAYVELTSLENYNN